MYKIDRAEIQSWIEQYSGERFHAVLCDPPYNLESITKRFGKKGSVPAKYGEDGSFSRVGAGFMNKTWDSDVAFNPKLWDSMSELLHPGAFGMAFSSTRTYHRLASAIEDAGFIIHPMIGWIQSQGFPKATRVDTQIDKKAGAKRKVVGKIKNPGSTKPRISMHDGWKENPDITEPATELATVWEGHRYGLQALKPCLEPICVFQKPFEGKPVDNIIETGAGTFWIEGTRFVTKKDFKINRFNSGMKPFGNAVGEEYTSVDGKGRWATNVLLAGYEHPKFNNFFYNAKVSKSEKEDGLDDIDGKYMGMSGGAQKKGKGYDKAQSIGLNRVNLKKNTHPTVKPISLIEYLATLILPPEHYQPRRILVPFSGVGSEMIGAMRAGWDYVYGIEIDEDDEYIDIAHARINHWTKEV